MESNWKPSRNLIRSWFIAGLFSWPAGFIVAVLLSEITINPWHPKETNVFIGLSMGAAAGFGQGYVLRKIIPLGKWWIWASCLGVGVPFAAAIMQHDLEVALPGFWNNQNILWGSTFVVCGTLAGILQLKVIRRHFRRAGLWIIVSVMAWTAAFALNLTIILPGLVLFAITGGGLVWVLKLRSN